MKNEFVKSVERDFQFLVNQFGFELLRSTASPRNDQWEGIVEYSTETTLIRIDCTRGGSPSVSIGRTKDGGNFLLPLQTIYEYSNLTKEDKEIIVSRSENKEASRILRDKQLYHLIPHSLDALERNPLVVKTFSDSTRKYALSLLRGDFAEWLSMWEYHAGKLIAENSRQGRPDSVPVVVTDESGKLRVVGKEPFLKKSLDYIKKLREENAN